MIRESKFILTHYPYAVDLSSFTPERDEDGARSGGAIDAVWFRRQKGINIAYIGLLWGDLNPPPTDAAELLARCRGGRDSIHLRRGRWDGTGYLGSVDPDVAAAHLEILRPMLEQYPAVPGGYDGWWRF